MDKNRVNEDWRSAELLAISGLCRDWAGSYADRLTGVEWSRKIVLFRKAIIAGVGKREQIPHEIAQSEHRIALARVRRLRELRDRGKDTPHTKVSVFPGLESIAKTCRWIPWNQELIGRVMERFDDSRCSDRSIATMIVSERFGIPVSTMNQILRRKPRIRFDDLQILASSLVFDLALSQPENQHRLSIKLLDALSRSAYPMIALYYVVQIAQYIHPNPLVFPPPELIVRRTCKLMPTRSEPLGFQRVSSGTQ